ncbi:MAG: amine dehydrogenase [Pseudomonadota bacterium]|nr:amine dehydrogenase [Pseudomonadota bacterium]
MSNARFLTEARLGRTAAVGAAPADVAALRRCGALGVAAAYIAALRRCGAVGAAPADVAARRPGAMSRAVAMSRIAALACVAAGIATASRAAADDFPTPLSAEPIPKVETLPARYPTGWSFLNYSGDRIELRNVGSDSREVKGQLQAHDSATLLVADKRPEIYVADTVWSRGVRGTRTDFITVYDRATFTPVGEIVLPGAKRALITSMEGLMAFTDDQRMVLVFNFTPASSVTVVDLVKRQTLSEIQIPGCSLVYPSGARGFATLCSSGTLLTIRLDANGAAAGRSETKAFNPLDTDPLFTASATVGGVRYFPSLGGRVQPIDLKGDEPKVLPDWPLVAAGDAAAHWRPSGWQILASDEQTLLYVIMQADAHEGTHKDPGNEVWVFNTATKARVKRIRLVRPGSSIALTHEPEPLLLVQAGERLDVYDAHAGSLVRSLDLPGFHTRMTIEPVR